MKPVSYKFYKILLIIYQKNFSMMLMIDIANENSKT